MGDIIPSVVDGLNELERMILYWALELSSQSHEERVNVLELTMTTLRSSSGYMLLLCQEAILRLAHNFVGTNNINFFQPVGNFGDRHKGPLYLRTGQVRTECMEILMNPITRMIFVKDDISLAMKSLEGCTSCGRIPTSLIPVIPFILVNGCDGNAGPSSWLKSCVPKYKLEDIISNLRLHLQHKEMVPMVPWFKGFQGKVELSPTNPSQYITTGVISHIDCTRRTATISELPIRVWTHDYKLWLNAQQWILSVEDLSELNESVLLEVTLSNEAWQDDEQCLMEKLELIRMFTLSEMRAVNLLGDVVEYENPLDIIVDFAEYRSQFYKQRKDMLLDDVNSDLSSVESGIKDCNAVVLDCSTATKSELSRLKDSPKMVKLQKTLASMCDILDTIERMNLADGNMLFDVVSFANEAVTLKKTLKKPKQNFSEDSLIALENVCCTLNKLKDAMCEMRTLHIKRRDLKYKLFELQTEDYLSLWLNDIERLELVFKNQQRKEDKERQWKTIEASTQRISRGRKRAYPYEDPCVYPTDGLYTNTEILS